MGVDASPKPGERGKGIMVLGTDGNTEDLGVQKRIRGGMESPTL